MAKKKFYVVWKGRETGIFGTWAECEKQIKGVDGAKFKSFSSKEMAETAFEGESKNFLGKNFEKPKLSEEDLRRIGNPNPDSLAVDAACSGNPGRMEYQGVDTKFGIMLFSGGPWEMGTINIGEFLAIVHGLAYLKERESHIPVYSDSKTAIKWIKDKKVNTKLEWTQVNLKLFDVVERAVKWLHSNEYPNKILKWETAAWGEIPADFGRK